MAGPNLEVFKFGFYLFFPVAMLLHYGNPEWYAKHVTPYKEKFWPPPEKTNQLPYESSDIRNEIERLRRERIARKSGIKATEPVDRKAGFDT